jgi:hypothetical protein
MKDQAVRDSFKNRPCCIGINCVGVTTPAHIGSYGASRIDAEWNIMPLCVGHHNEQGKIGILTFIKKYPRVKSYIENKGWTFNFLGKLVSPVPYDSIT